MAPAGLPLHDAFSYPRFFQHPYIFPFQYFWENRQEFNIVLMSSGISLFTSRFSFSLLHKKRILFYPNHRARLSDGPFPGSVAAPLESLQIAFSHGFPAFCQKSCSSRAFCLVSSCWLLCRSRTERLFPETATAALESSSRGEPGMDKLDKAWLQSSPTLFAFCSSQHSFSIIALVKISIECDLLDWSAFTQSFSMSCCHAMNIDGWFSHKMINAHLRSGI